MKKTACSLLLALMSVSGITAQNLIYFDTPCSLKGRQAWWEGHPERFADGKKPISAGESPVNFDSEWEQRSLPLGNGSIGCNVMGSVSVERYTLNEKTLWRGGPGTAKGPADYWNANKESAHLLPEIRKAFADGDWDKAASLTAQNFNSTVPYEAYGEPQFRFGSYTTLGELTVETDLAEGVQNYRRTLSVDSAVAEVKFEQDGIAYVRRTFISYPANVMAVRFTASRPGSQNLRIAYTCNPLSEGKFEADGTGGLLFVGQLDNNGMRYAVRLKTLPEGGTCVYADGVLEVKRADAVTILLTADTDYKPNYNPDFADAAAYVGTDPLKTTAAWLRHATKKGFENLFAEHYADYAALFRRVQFNIDAPAAASATQASYSSKIRSTSS